MQPLDINVKIIFRSGHISFFFFAICQFLTNETWIIKKKSLSFPGFFRPLEIFSFINRSSDILNATKKITLSEYLVKNTCLILQIEAIFERFKLSFPSNLSEVFFSKFYNLRLCNLLISMLKLSFDLDINLFFCNLSISYKRAMDCPVLFLLFTITSGIILWTAADCHVISIHSCNPRQERIRSFLWFGKGSFLSIARVAPQTSKTIV